VQNLSTLSRNPSAIWTQLTDTENITWK